MDAPSYVNAATVRSAADLPSTPKADRDIARCIDDGSRAVETLCGGRLFYPLTGTRTIDWPDRASVNRDSRKLWLDANEAASLSAVSAGSTTITSWRLGPAAPEGPPYRWLETDYSLAETFSTSATASYQDAISLTGVFAGCPLVTATAGALNGAVATTTATTLTVTNGAAVSTGDAILIGSEYMIVTGESWADTGEDLLAGMLLDSSDTAITVADGTAYTAGELLFIDKERMIIDDIAGNVLYVTRQVNGTSIAVHALGADIFARRGLTVTRGALGSTAATHLDAAAVVRHVPPAGVTSLALAETLVLLANENAAYARVIGSGDNEREARGGTVKDLRKTVRDRYARKGAVYAAGGKS